MNPLLELPDSRRLRSNDTIATSYFHNLLAIRTAARASGRVFWNVITSNQVRPFRAAPTPASLAFQVYTTLAAGGRGIAYFTYYTGDGLYRAGPLWNFQPTPTWGYLRDVNHAVRPLLPTLSHLTSKSVYSGPNPPAPGLPVLPGAVVAGVQSDQPLMVGELRDLQGTAYVAVVNLNVLKRATFTLKLRESAARLRLVPGRQSVRKDAALRLEAGGGIVLRVLPGN